MGNTNENSDINLILVRLSKKVKRRLKFYLAYKEFLRKRQFFCNFHNLTEFSDKLSTPDSDYTNTVVLFTIGDVY